MHKGLIKLVLLLFLLPVIYPGQYAGATVSRNYQPNQQEQLKASAQLLSSVKILSHAGPVTFIAHSAVKPVWLGKADVPGTDHFTIICQTLFGQNSRSITYSLQFCKRLLFPFHFFW